MSNTVKILHLEDNPKDAELLEELLFSDGFQCQITVVQNKEDFEDELNQNEFDLIISDFSLPGYDGLSALQYSNKTTPETPFVFVSGTIGEEAAIESLLNGATDYVLKQKIKRLFPAIERSLALSRERKRRRQIEHDLRKSEGLYRTLTRNFPNGAVFLFDKELRFSVADGKGLEGLGFIPELLQGRTVWDVFPGEISNIFAPRFRDALSGTSNVFELKIADNLYEIYSYPVMGEAGNINSGIMMMQDITGRKQTEEALVESEIALRSIFESVPDCIKLLERDGKVRQMNRAGLKLLEAPSPDLVINKCIYPMVQDLYRQQFIDVVERTFEGKSSHLEFEIKNFRGKILWLETDTVPFKNQSGNIIAALAITRDITDRRKGEDALRQSEERFRSIYEYSPTGIATISKEGKFLNSNSALQNILGYSEQELQQLTFSDITYEEDINVGLELFQRLISGKKGQVGFQKRYRKKNGDIVWAEVIASVVMDKRGHVLYTVTMIEDITNRKIAEEKIQEQAALLNIDTDSIYVRDMDNKILFWNNSAQNLYGYSSEEVSGKKDMDILFNEAPEIFLEANRKVIQEGFWKGELRQVTRNSREIIVQSQWTLVTDFSGKPKSVYVVNTDITRKKELEIGLMRSQRLESLGTLAGGIAHDFNNILSIIIGHTTLLNQQKPAHKGLQGHIDAIEKASNRGAGLVRQLLTFARKSDINTEYIVLNDVVNEVSKLLMQTFPRTISMKTELAPDLPVILGDSTQLNQVVLNLCINARDAMLDGGELKIITNVIHSQDLKNQLPEMTDGKYIELTVQDSGTGMDEETKSKVFEPFFTTKEQGKGTGLGLSVVFGIIESHKGFINVDSKPGKGTAFRLYFRVVPGPNLESVDTPIIDDAELPTGTETILLVEDEEMLREVAKASLAGFGYNIITAEDGIHAMQVYKERKDEIDLVLTDFGLPKMNGESLLKELKAINPELPVILASGFLDPEIKRRLNEYGVSELVQKPYSMEEMLKKIRNALE